MSDVYKFFASGEGKTIGKLAFEGDILCRKIINRYVVHYKDQECEEAAQELREVLKEYSGKLWKKKGKWPPNVPFSLRSYVYISKMSDFTRPGVK